ncbi:MULTISPECIES: GNAT family N-acetyltransferase [Aequorivita]|uniref:GNAT family N-acetyltransferase n=1 Tax=Aequorivita iocasae TaxID=2803865 RepID=A0ABX7DT30_9FLAO|nr:MULTISPECIES: GNAT family N-acetyltransferase [Aequorivita]QQX76962.1 GNAT family N-acetyltransferase [Aequorivita iocasae]UCA56441.1 GNAT family N-acetyltransferase [Aequorivita sp. F7]
MASEIEISIKVIPPSEIFSIVPYLQILGNNAVPEAVIKERLKEMVQQNYECLGIFDEEKLIGICGLWFQTRHYAGRSLEMDHVIIDHTYRRHGIGKMLVDFVSDYAAKKSCNWVELNSYVHNFPSHKFFYNQGFVAKGYHFVKEL